MAKLLITSARTEVSFENSSGPRSSSLEEKGKRIRSSKKVVDPRGMRRDGGSQLEGVIVQSPSIQLSTEALQVGDGLAAIDDPPGHAIGKLGIDWAPIDLAKPQDASDELSLPTDYAVHEAVEQVQDRDPLDPTIACLAAQTFSAEETWVGGITEVLVFGTTAGASKVVPIAVAAVPCIDLNGAAPVQSNSDPTSGPSDMAQTALHWMHTQKPGMDPQTGLVDSAIPETPETVLST